MPASRPWAPSLGDSAEQLVAFVTSQLPAFVTQVPWQRDHGHDLLCTRAVRRGTMLLAGAAFTIQVKSKCEPIEYPDHARQWLADQEVPFFLCVANLRTLTVEFYSTWNRLLGTLGAAVPTIVLDPCDGTGWPEPATAAAIQRIPLGEPVLKVTAQEAVDQKLMADRARCLDYWIRVDRTNISNAAACMHWILRPPAYQTNVTPDDPAAVHFFCNPANIARNATNYWRAATELRTALTMSGDVTFGPLITAIDQGLRPLVGPRLVDGAALHYLRQRGVDLPDSP